MNPPAVLIALLSAARITTSVAGIGSCPSTFVSSRDLHEDRKACTAACNAGVYATTHDPYRYMARTLAHTHTHTHAHAHACTHARTHARTHTHTHNTYTQPATAAQTIWGAVRS